MSVRLLAGLGLCASALPVVAWAQASAGDPEGNWAAIVSCGTERTAEARHQCVDGVLRATGVLTEVRVVQETREEFGREDRPEAPRAPEPPRVAAPAPAVVAASPPPPPAIDELVTTIASVRTVGYRRVRVTTAEGSIWEQTRDETFATAPKPGDAFSVERASMGSFQCRFGRSSNFRCQRVD